jgi:hypothetical protein
MTMYDEPQSLLVANPINRYLVNSPMLPQFKGCRWRADVNHPERISRQGQGIQLAARTKGAISTIMRLYWPKEEALDGKWTAPPLSG